MRWRTAIQRIYAQQSQEGCTVPGTHTVIVLGVPQGHRSAVRLEGQGQYIHMCACVFLSVSEVLCSGTVMYAA